MAMSSRQECHTVDDFWSMCSMMAVVFAAGFAAFQNPSGYCAVDSGG